MTASKLIKNETIRSVSEYLSRRSSSTGYKDILHSWNFCNEMKKCNREALALETLSPNRSPPRNQKRNFGYRRPRCFLDVPQGSNKKKSVWLINIKCVCYLIWCHVFGMWKICLHKFELYVSICCYIQWHS